MDQIAVSSCLALHSEPAPWPAAKDIYYKYSRPQYKYNDANG